ncbi:MAG: hypothetical protein Q7Q71_13780 [Verrucomicrobiota bacterium JB023]|nr:hypothetical protein [Verrucomicrobiota bacterium JB023]
MKVFPVPTCIVVSSCLALPNLFAASATWILDENVSLFGEWANGSGGVQSPGYSGPFEEFSTAASNLSNFNNGIHLPSTAANFDEAPVDATSLLMSHRNLVGTSYLVDTQNAFDLSSEGDSLRIVFANHYLHNYAPDGASYGSNFTLWEVGISTTAQSVFGGVGDDSFFFAGVNTTNPLTRETNQKTPDNTFDVVTYTDSSVGGVNGGDTLAGGNVLAADLNLDALAINGPSDARAANASNPGGVTYLYDLTIVNASATTFDILYTITEFDATGMQLSDTVTPTGVVFSGTQEDVVHDLDSESLSSVYLGLGYRTLDSNNPNSGTTFDYNSVYSISVPEPGSALLLVLSLPVLYRRRR